MGNVQKEKKVSVVIPIYIPEERADRVQILNFTQDCIQSLNGYDELILQFDLNRDGFARTVNEGIKRATGDYIAIVNNDTKMLNGSIRDMCKFFSVVRPKLIEGDMAKFAFAVVDRRVFDVIGLFDEDFHIGFYEDDDFLDRCQRANVRLLDNPSQVWHYGGATISQMNPDYLMDINKHIYETKRSLRDK